MPYSLIDYFAGQMAAHFGRLPPRPGGFRPGGFRRPGGGFRRPFRRPFFPRRGPWVGPGPAPVYYETEPLCTDEWGTPIPCEPVAVAYPEPASTLDMSDVWSQQDEDELEGVLGAIEDEDDDEMGFAIPGSYLAHRQAAARLDVRGQVLQEKAARLRAAGKERKAARVERRAHRADVRSDWKAAQATADLTRRDARQAMRQAMRQGSNALDFWSMDDEDELKSLLSEMTSINESYRQKVKERMMRYARKAGGPWTSEDERALEKLLSSVKKLTAKTQRKMERKLTHYAKRIEQAETPEEQQEAQEAFAKVKWQANFIASPEGAELRTELFAPEVGALDDTHEVWTQDDEEDLEAMLAMPNESEQVGALDDTHEVWSQDDEEDLEAMLADGEASSPMGSACDCGLGV